MANLAIPQGTLNRLLTSCLWTDHPELNVTASFLMPEGIDFTPEGQATQNFPSMTGIVTSPEPYQPVRFTLHIIKAQALADAYMQQLIQSSLMGDATLRSDSGVLSPIAVNNGSLLSMPTLTFSGRDAGFVIPCYGFVSLNSALWQ